MYESAAEDEYGKEDPGGGSSIAEASFNFINSIVSATIY